MGRKTEQKRALRCFTKHQTTHNSSVDSIRRSENPKQNMNSYEIQYALLGHLAGVLTFELFAFDRDSLVETGKCPTSTETKAYSAYQLMAEDVGISTTLVLGFFASWFMVTSRLLQKRTRSAFDIVSFTQHLLLGVTFLRNLGTFSDIRKAGPYPSEIFQCKTVMLFAMTHLGQLCIQVLTMFLLNHFAYDETQKNVNKDRKRALSLYSATYALAGFISGYYWIFCVMFDRIAFMRPTVDLLRAVRLQHTYSSSLTAPPVFMLASPFALMSTMLLTMFRWSIWRSRVRPSWTMVSLTLLVDAH